jgi:hypothetical protein
MVYVVNLVRKDYKYIERGCWKDLLPPSFEREERRALREASGEDSPRPQRLLQPIPAPSAQGQPLAALESHHEVPRWTRQQLADGF